MLIKPISEQSNITNQQAQSNGAGSQFNEFSSGNSNLAVHKQAFYSIAKIIASLTVTNQKDGKVVIEKFINDIKDTKSRDSTRLLALLCLGETGKYMFVYFSTFSNL